MSRNHIIALVIVVLVVAGLGFWINKVNKNIGYSVVYLTTGEIYIGKLTTFPGLELKDSYVLQVVTDSKDATKNTFQIQPLREALWAPKTLHLVKDNVVFYGPISPDSEIAKTLAEQGQSLPAKRIP